MDCPEPRRHWLNRADRACRGQGLEAGSGVSSSPQHRNWWGLWQVDGADPCEPSWAQRPCWSLGPQKTSTQLLSMDLSVEQGVLREQPLPSLWLCILWRILAILGQTWGEKVPNH